MTKFFILICALPLLSCGGIDSASDTKASQASPLTVWANQWNEENARYWYATPQGSHFMSWEIFMGLEAANSTQLFATRENLKKYGWVYPDSNFAAYQADPRLPLGFLKDRSDLDGKDYVGFTCAACHTGEFRDGNRQILVHAASTMAQFDVFLTDLRAALLAQQEPNKFDRLKARLDTQRGRRRLFEDSVAKELARSTDLIEKVYKSSMPVVPLGPGRLDAIGSILNTLLAEKLDIPGNWRPVRAPVSYPVLWRVTDLQCVQTNCLATNPLTRNIGQVLGVFGHVNLKEVKLIPNQLELLWTKLFKGTLFQSTPKIANLYGLEESLKTLAAPSYRQTFGDIDPSRADRGRVIYDEQCASCHMNIEKGVSENQLTPINSLGRRFIKVTKVPYLEAGTDPMFVEEHGPRMAKPGILADVLLKLDPATKVRPTEVPALKLLGLTTLIISQKFFSSPDFKSLAAQDFVGESIAKATEELRKRFVNFQEASVLGDAAVYRARPLDGVAFSAPYLHNGSVPTLWDLLQAPERRPLRFRLGALSYDKAKLGYRDEGSFTFDTKLPGNGNGGHVHGTDLQDEQKRDLLEYLKVL